MISRRKFFSAVPAAAAGATVAPSLLAEIPCHTFELSPNGEINIVHFVARQERKAPKVEYEANRTDYVPCEVCGELYPKHYKKKYMLVEGGWDMLIPPIYKSNIVCVVQEGCNIWLDEKEVEWENFEITNFSISGHKHRKTHI